MLVVLTHDITIRHCERTLPTLMLSLWQTRDIRYFTARFADGIGAKNLGIPRLFTDIPFAPLFIHLQNSTTGQER